MNYKQTLINHYEDEIKIIHEEKNILSIRLNEFNKELVKITSQFKEENIVLVTGGSGFNNDEFVVRKIINDSFSSSNSIVLVPRFGPPCIKIIKECYKKDPISYYQEPNIKVILRKTTNEKQTKL